MATGWPMKTTYANGDVYSASDVNDITGTINLLGSSVAYTAGKNKILNSDFRIWQRGTSFTATGYTADRWLVDYNGTGATNTVSQQTFTPGTAPVAGYEGTYFYRFACSVAGTGNTYKTINQRIEDVRVFAGQTVTVSFWAKAAATTTINNIYLAQVFGSGGSGDVNTNVASTTTLTTSWQRFSYSVANPSISGKTIGTNSWLGLQFNLPTNATFTVDFWGVQVEAGSTATAFQTATGTIQGELGACQRYYFRTTAGQSSGALSTLGSVVSTILMESGYQFPVPMRTSPTSLDYSNILLYQTGASTTAVSSMGIYANYTSPLFSLINAGVASGLTTGKQCVLVGSSSTSYIGFSAEL